MCPKGSLFGRPTPPKVTQQGKGLLSKSRVHERAEHLAKQNSTFTKNRVHHTSQSDRQLQLLLATMDLTKYCTEQRSTWRKAENVAMNQFPSIILNIIIINVIILISSRHVVSAEVVVDDTRLSATSTRNIIMLTSTTQSQHHSMLRLTAYFHTFYQEI